MNPARWLPVILAVLVSVPILLNTWVHDDITVIATNDQLHHAGTLWKVFTQSYWPPPYRPDLYRPFSSLLFGLEWIAGGSRPIVARLGSIALFTGVVTALTTLGTRLTGRQWAACVIGVWFAAQPVHSEAIAAAVNQSELLVGLLATLMVLQYLALRANGPMPASRILLLLGTYLLACLTKESGVTLVGLLVAAELWLVRDARPWRARLAVARPILLACLMIALAFIAIRTRILGDAVGSFTAEALEGLTMGQRALTMLAVVPRWLFLLSWPTHLQVDYSPQVILPATRWGTEQTAGALLLVAAVALFVWSMRRAPLAAFGLAWVAIGLFPVSNVLVPTGIVLAERTMLLPSIGVGLTLLPLVVRALDGIGAVRWRQQLVLAVMLVLVVDGGARLVARFRAWRSLEVFWPQALADAPDSYRANLALGELLWATDRRGSGEALMRRAISLNPKSAITYPLLGDLYRQAGFCHPAIDVYKSGLEIAPGLSGVRASLIACLIYDGRYAEGRRASREAMALQVDVDAYRAFGHTADSAAAVAAPAHSVRLVVPPTMTADKIH